MSLKSEDEVEGWTSANISIYGEYSRDDRLDDSVTCRDTLALFRKSNLVSPLTRMKSCACAKFSYNFDLH